MSYSRIESLLKDHMGLDPHTVGSSTIERAIRQRMNASGHGDNVTSYCAMLLQSHDELRALIDKVIIPETWFFRDMRPFLALRNYVSREWLPAHKGGELRILSIPCSTGEEPYSIAMTLEELKFSAKHCRIDAVDISSENLVKAKRALYRRNSFRGEDLSYRERHFEPEGDSFQLQTNIQERVTFTGANMLSPDFLLHHQPYDIIFCRNLLIYFDRPTQELALTILRRLLKPKGILFIGHAESGLFIGRWNLSGLYPSAFAFRQFNDLATPVKHPIPARTQINKRRTQTRKPTIGKGRVAIEINNVEPLKLAPLQTHEDGIDKALQLANGGHLAEAASLCEHHIQTEGPSALAFYLLGLVREAAGDSSQAETFWRKTIYLEPKHIEALTHLALILERRGESQEAQRLRQRAQRASLQQTTEVQGS